MTQSQRVADERILVNTAATISAQFLDQYGDPADPGTVTVGIVDEAGATVVAAGTATSGSSTSPRQYTIAYNLVPETTFLHATWSGSSTGTLETIIEVVSGFYFTVAQVRTHKHGEMADANDYPLEKIREARLAVEHEFERVCWPFLPRYRRVIVDGCGGRVFLPDMHVRRIRSVREYAYDNTTYSDWTAAEVASIVVTASGAIYSPRPFYGATAIEYEYGFDRPNARVIDAALARLRYLMNSDRSGVPERATSYVANEGGTFRLTTADRGGSVTGMPDVDVVLNDPRYKRPRRMAG